MAIRQDLEADISETADGVFHPSGTCRKGAGGDRLAVTGHVGKVRGMDGRFIGAASLMPTIPSANTNVPTIMMAERSRTG